MFSVASIGKSKGEIARRFGDSVLIPLKDRADAVAVWDMQTMAGDDVANIVPGAAEYDLALSNVILGGGSHPDYQPTIDAEGLVFPVYGEDQNTAVAAGTGTASIASALTLYVAFTRDGATSGASFGFTTLVNSTLALIRTLDPEEAPRIHAPTASPYVIGRWNDGLPHLLCAIVDATSARMFLDGCLVMDFAESNSLPVTLSQFDLSELTKGFAGKVFYAGAFDTAHDAETRADVFAQIQAALALRSVTVAAPPACVFYEGDSIRENSYIVGATAQHPYGAVTTLSPIPPAMIFAHHGDVIADFTARAATVDAAIAESAAAIKVLSILPTNDIQIVGDGAAAFASLTAYCAARKAANPGLLILVGTPVVRDIAGYEAKRVVLRGLINGGDPSYDAVADFGGDAELGNEANAVFSVVTTYFEDGIHPNAAGHARMVPIEKAAIAPLLGIVLPTEYTDLKSYSNSAVYSLDGDLPPRADGAAFTITGGTGFTPGTYAIGHCYVGLPTEDGTKNVYTGAFGLSHPVSGGHYTL